VSLLECPNLHCSIDFGKLMDNQTSSTGGQKFAAGFVALVWTPTLYRVHHTDTNL